jgi:hypothetical protein
MVPSRGFGMVLLCNTPGCVYADEVFVKAFEVVLGEPPVPAATDKDDAAALANYVGEYATVTGAQDPVVVTSTGNGLHLTWGSSECDLVPGYPSNFRCPQVFSNQVWFMGGSGGPAEHVCSYSFSGHRHPHVDAGADAAGE